MRKTSLRTTGRTLAVMVATLAIVLAACGSSDDGGSGSGDGGDKEALIVGSKDVAGAQVLSQAYGQALEAEGYQITYKAPFSATSMQGERGMVRAAVKRAVRWWLRRLTDGQRARRPSRRSALGDRVVPTAKPRRSSRSTGLPFAPRARRCPRGPRGAP